jgi:hypothetical protein
VKNDRSFPAAAWLRGNPVTQQEQGHCDAKIKRLEAGSFQSLDPTAKTPMSGPAGLELSVTDLAMILGGVDLTTARRRKRYSRAG